MMTLQPKANLLCTYEFVPLLRSTLADIKIPGFLSDDENKLSERSVTVAHMIFESHGTLRLLFLLDTERQLFGWNLVSDVCVQHSLLTHAEFSISMDLSL